MNISRNIFLSFFLVLAVILPSHATLRIVATTPDVADIVRRIGGDLVKVDSLAKGTEDIHAVPQRPSFLPLLNRADGVAHIGLGAEHAFLPALLEAASNPDVMPGKKGDIDCSRYITPMDVPTNLSRAEGELHPDGNPHYNTDPRKGELMVRAIAEGLERLDPAHRAQYEKNKQLFVDELKIKISEWKHRAGPLKGLKIVSQHRDMVYLADFLELVIEGEVEPKPGIAPSPKHLAELAELMKAHQVKIIVNEVQYSDKNSVWLAEQTHAKMAVVSTMGGAFADAGTYFGMIDHNIRAILAALK